MTRRVALKYIGAGILGAAAVAAVALGVLWAQDAYASEPTLPAIWVEVGNPAAGQPRSPYIKGKEGNRVLVPAGYGVTGEHFQRWRACPISGFMGVTDSGHIKVKGGGIAGTTHGVDVLLNRYVSNAARSYGPYHLKAKGVTGQPFADSEGGPFPITSTNLATIRDALSFMENPRDGFPSRSPSYERNHATGRIYESGARSYSITDGALGATVHNGVAAFTIRLAKPSKYRVTVYYSTSAADSTASPASVGSTSDYLMDGTHDFLPVSGSVTFQPGETAKQVRSTIINDCVDDAGETVAFKLVNYEIFDGDTSITYDPNADHPLHTAMRKVMLANGVHSAHKSNYYIIQNHDTVAIPENFQPTVASAISDATIVSESGTHKASLSGVFSDPDSDTLTIAAESSDTAIATVAVATDQSSLTVTAKKRGAAVITVTASDGNGGSVHDTFTVTVKSAPVILTAIDDVGELVIGATHKVSVSGVFSDADSDALTITATSSSDAIATAAVAADGSSVNLAAKSRGTATVTVTAQDSDDNTVSEDFDVAVVNRAPTVASAIADATIVNETGTHKASLSGVFIDADGDGLTISAVSSDETVATVSVSADYATLTVSALGRGTATITVTADDDEATAEDTFTVTLKAAPTVASAIADVSELDVDATHKVSLSSAFSDADGDNLTVTANSSNDSVATVAVAADYSGLTLTGKGTGTATITVIAQDSDGNTVSDAFDVTVPAAQQQQAVELPGPVVGLAVTASREDSVTVSWSTPETGGAPQGYIVHLRPQNGEKGSGKTKRPKAKKTQVKFNKLESGQTYQVWVRAQNEAGKGERVHASITMPE